MTGNYERVDIEAPFPNCFSKMSHTIVSINALTQTTVTPQHENSAPVLQLILPLAVTASFDVAIFVACLLLYLNAK